MKAFSKMSMMKTSDLHRLTYFIFVRVLDM